MYRVAKIKKTKGNYNTSVNNFKQTVIDTQAKRSGIDP
jgi:hypothetical protein